MIACATMQVLNGTVERNCPLPFPAERAPAPPLGDGQLSLRQCGNRETIAAAARCSCLVFSFASGLSVAFAEPRQRRARLRIEDVRFTVSPPRLSVGRILPHAREESVRIVPLQARAIPFMTARAATRILSRVSTAGKRSPRGGLSCEG